MDYLDLYVTSSEMKEKLELAKKLDLKGIGFAISSSDDIDAYFKDIESLESDLDIVKTLIVEADGARQLKNIVSKYREKFDVIMVSGGDYAINRAAVENSKVDVLLHPELRRSDSGVDHVIAKLARNNDIAIGISTHSLLTTYKKIRAQILAHHRNNLMICEHFNTQIIITSGAQSKWDMRDLRDMAGIANILGYPINKAMDSVTTVPWEIVERNRKKLSGEIVSEGVEVEEDG